MLGIEPGQLACKASTLLVVLLLLPQPLHFEGHAWWGFRIIHVGAQVGCMSGAKCKASALAVLL